MVSCDKKLGVIFDMDGVLVDTGWAHRQAWFDLAESEGLEMTDEFFQRTFGMQNAAILPMLRPGISKEELERLSDWKEEHYRELMQEHVELAPGAEALLQDLKQYGFRLAIGSSAPPENLNLFWDRLSLAQWFDARVTKEEVTRSKPAPETFLKAAEKLGLAPACCAVVEDAVPGVQAGKAAGMPVVAVTTTRQRADLAQADHIVDSLSDLKATDFLALLKPPSAAGRVCPAHQQTTSEDGVRCAPYQTLASNQSLAAIYGKLVLTALFWGATFIAGRQVAQDLGPFSIAFLRFALASVLLLSLTRIKEGRLPRVDPRQALLVVLLGLTGVFAYNALFFKGLSLIEASRASLIVATCPAFIAIASVLFFRERLAALQVLGIPLSILGAAVVIAKGDLRQIVAGGVGLGELCILGCVLNWTAYSLIGKVALRRLSPLVSVSYSSLAGALALLFPALYEGLTRTIHRASLLDWTSIAYLAVCGTVIGFVWFYQGVQLIGATRAGLFINFVPISAVILAFFMLQEPITWSLAVGAVLVLSGVYLTNRRGEKA